jgi:hypothetical protein
MALAFTLGYNEFMRAVLAYFWRRRWRSLLIALLLLAPLPLLDPYLRQSIFGPKIHGVPWCKCEADIRWHADPRRYQPNLLQRTMTEWGWLEDETPAAPPCDDEALPLYLLLTEDQDVKVRRLALGHVCANAPDTSKILPTLRKRLNDDDPLCRLTAAQCIWERTEDPEMKPVLLALLERGNLSYFDGTWRLIKSLARNDPEMLEPLSKLAERRNDDVGVAAVLSMSYFGKRALPVLRRHLRGKDRELAFAAIGVVGRLGTDAEELIPDILLWENDPDRAVRWSIAWTLHQIAPKRFPNTPPFAPVVGLLR